MHLHLPFKVTTGAASYVYAAMASRERSAVGEPISNAIRLTK